MKKKINKRSISGNLCAIGLCLLILSSCTQEKYISLDEQIRKEYHIAVVLPFSEGMESRWKKSVNWALENLNISLEVERRIRITAEWYNEEQYNTENLFAQLAARDDIQAVIGPLYSVDAAIAAECCAATNKPLFPALSSSELMMRTYAGRGFLWCLTENDISQCELLLARAKHKGAKSVSLLTCNTIYGQTFTDWFAFQAKELNLTVHSMEIYEENNIREKMEPLLSEVTDCLICISSGNEITRKMNELRIKHTNSHPFLLFSDGAFLISPDSSYEGMEGIVQIQDPQSGFHIAYETRYGESPEYGSAHFYDATLLAGLGILRSDLSGNPDINAALRNLVNGTGEEINDCSDENVSQIVSSLITGKNPHVTGASGKLRFDPSLYTNVLHSVYCHWLVYQGKHIILEYGTSDDGNRTSSSVTNWNRRMTQMQDFSQTTDRFYPPKNGLYALIIATSSGWENYRHQADAFALYQLLKTNGLDDNHILMVAEDDIAFHTRNSYPGYIMTQENGPDVYKGVKVDCRISETDLTKIAAMMSDNLSSHHPNDTDNLLVYWIGHGTQEGLNWLDKTIPADNIVKFFNRLTDKKHYRKALFIIEACYAGKTGNACKGISGLLCITAANADETSKVNRYSYELRTWLSNSFTDTLLEEFTLHPNNSLYELYGNVYNRTMGSHVSVYNADYFDNLYTSGLHEFLYP